MGVRYYAVWSLRRGVIDPPEPLPPEIEDAIWRAEFWASQGKRPEPQPDVEVIWMRDAKEFREQERRKRRSA